MTGFWFFLFLSFSILKMHLLYLFACIAFENKSIAIHPLVPLYIVCLFTLAVLKFSSILMRWMKLEPIIQSEVSQKEKHQYGISSVQFISVAQSCPTLCDPMNHSTPGLPVHHQLPEFTQTHVHRVGDAIQPSHPRSSPSPPAPNPSQHQSLFQ